MNELALMAHVGFGVTCLLAALWVLVETLNVSVANVSRIRFMAWVAAAAMWLAYFAGGYWYVVFYHFDKTVILQGPWPFAHTLFMETKEHLVIVLLMAATYLPIAAEGDFLGNRLNRKLVLLVAGVVIVMTLLIEGEGALIALGVKLGLRAHSAT